MSAIIKRKLTETWRESLASRLGDAAPERIAEGLAAFDEAVLAGEGEAEAAFATLSSFGLLWHVDGAGFTPSGPPEADRQDNKHSVPSV